ncbi:MAG: SMC family ATPase [Thermomicrobium sp.]|nr:SMC family ATPase [Thermomicrobium sp.]
MIPTRLRLQGFLCYRDPVEVDFTGLYLACLSGENGAGKSALLDAMTWALWEEARASNQHLVSLGESETRVEFSFLLDGREYRVVRGYTPGARSRSVLELHVRHGDEWRPFATGSKTAVQREIDRLLGISYTTFVNSAFLLQGKADEFTRRTPTERKKILAELLELDRYDRYRDLAREEARRLRDERLRLEREHELLSARAAEVPELRSRLAGLERVVEERQETLRRYRDRVAAWQERVQRLSLEIERYRERQARAQALLNEREQLLATLERLSADERRHRELLGREEEVRARADERRRLEQTVQEFARILAERQQLTERIGRLTAEREARQQRLLHELRTREEQLLRCDRELAQRPELERERQRLEIELAKLARLHAERADVEARISALRERSAVLQAILASSAAYEARQRELSAELRSLEQQHRQLAEEVTRRAQLEQERRRLETELTCMSTVRSEREAVESQLATLRTQEAELKAIGKHLRAHLEELAARLQQLERLDAVCPVCLRPLSPEDRERQVEALRAEIGQVRREFDARGQDVRTIREQIASLERWAQELDLRLREEGALQAELGRIRAELERLDRVEQQVEALHRSIQRLREAEHSDPLLLSLERDIQELERRLATTTDRPVGTVSERAIAYRREAAEIESELAELERHRDRLGEQLRAESTLQARLGRLAAELDRLALLERERSQLEQELDQLREATRSDPALAELTRQIEKLEERLASLPYDEEAHRRIAERLEELASVEEELRALDQARVALDHVRQQIAQLEERKQAVDDELATVEVELARTTPPERDLASARHELEEASHALADAEAALQAVQAELGALRQRLHDAERAAEETHRIARELDRLAREQAVLEELERAFGKHGIQTLILENVLPELADAANEILDKLPGNTLRVDFATQRERASGDGAIETLDILISDEHGQRPYELYSGGEAFRIDFALRVALSTLLAQRAGHRLETLVIDEGFGTQDAKGREGLIQALQTVRDRFALILVITHIEELKDQFPQRIEVIKTPNGSQVTVIA